jgi:peptidoglycan/LPS O-acetylase OafA/YrhL
MPLSTATLRRTSSEVPSISVEASPRAKSLSGRHLPELDGLRGIAVTLVVLFHEFAMVEKPLATPASYLSRLCILGWSGVDLFFVLSGFLIGGILLDNSGSPRYYRAFYARRVCRIFPLYYAVLAIAAALLVLNPSGSPILKELGAPFWSFFAFVQIFWMAKWGSCGQSVLSVTWSLAVEEMSYLCLPWLLRHLPPRRRLLILTVIVFCNPLFRALVAPLGLPSFSILIFRGDGISLGVWAAALLRTPGALDWLRARRWALYAPLILLSPVIFRLDFPMHLTQLEAIEGVWRYTFVCGFFLSLLLLAVVHPQGWWAAMLRARFLQFLGRLSYGIYLQHLLVLAGCLALVGRDKLVLYTAADYSVVLLALTLTLILATLSFRYFEQPILKRGRSVSY